MSCWSLVDVVNQSLKNLENVSKMFPSVNYLKKFTKICMSS